VNPPLKFENKCTEFDQSTRPVVFCLNGGIIVAEIPIQHANSDGMTYHWPDNGQIVLILTNGKAHTWNPVTC
jgi:hypothetical protein